VPAASPDPVRRLSLVLAAATLVTTGASAEGHSGAATGACVQPRASAASSARIRRALRAQRDVWGNALLAAPNGPTYEGARRFLGPLLLARAAGKTPLTPSGVHYVPLAQPLDGARGAGSVALHLADGSRIVSERVGGRSLGVGVGARGREPYGSCLRRLATPRLAEGYLPILQTAYADASGVRYRQESFAARLPRTGSLVSFVELIADARRSTAGTTELRFGALRHAVALGTVRTVRVAWGDRAVAVDEEAYRSARESVRAYWERRLAEGASIVVPERRVMDAQRALLVQNLALTWRYSIGNAYEQFSFPESVDVAQVLAEYGFRDVSAAILRTSLTRRPTPYPNWKMGEKLLGSAVHYRLFRDRAYVRHATPALRRYVAALERQIRSSPRGILARERYSSDIADSVYGLHSQAVAWQGLRAMAGVWAETGDPGLGRVARAASARLGSGLRRAVAASQRRLPDGSLFVPVRLLDGEGPYDALTRSRAGSYWNLVMPYALASGLFRPRGPQANGIFGYMERHGSRLLGLVRAGAYALYRDPAYPTSGTDEVYGINVARFLADNDRPDQLVLSLYGQLAAAMTPETFVAGEAASVAPLAGSAYRSMYLPPNSASNAAFLVKLRLMLVHERRSRAGGPDGLELAYATPRPWLRPGRRIAVRGMPSSFGPVSFSIEATRDAVAVALEVPDRARPRALRLRLRLPRPNRVTGVVLDGRPYRRFDPRTETVDLSGLRGRLQLLVRYAPR
jgi:hypothetical protein